MNNCQEFKDSLEELQILMMYSNKIHVHQFLLLNLELLFVLI